MVKAAAAKIPDGGSIINMSSVASSVKGAPNRFEFFIKGNFMWKDLGLPMGQLKQQ